MPVIFQKFYRRADARFNRDGTTRTLAQAISNGDVLYVYGDNVKRVGLGGQARELRGEPNAVGVATKYTPSEHFGELPEEIIAQCRIIDNDMKPLFQHVKQGGVVIWPMEGIGTERAALDKFAPSTFDHIQKKLAALLRVGKLYARGDFEAAMREANQHA